MDSLIDYTTANPDALPDGWTMENDQALQDPNECVVLFEGSNLEPPGTFSIVEEHEGVATEYGSSVEHRLLASIWTEDVGLAIVLTRAASAYQYAEVNPGSEIEIRVRDNAL